RSTLSPYTTLFRSAEAVAGAKRHRPRPGPPGPAAGLSRHRREAVPADADPAPGAHRGDQQPGLRPARPEPLRRRDRDPAGPYPDPPGKPDPVEHPGHGAQRPGR